MPSSGRYQSQVLSFLSQQSLKLRDRTLRGLRQVKVAATWGAQVLLYPVYLAFQTTRLVSRQIGRSMDRIFPALRAAAQAVQQNTQPPSQTLPTVPPQADTPIRRTLQSLQIFGLPVPLSSQAVRPLTLPGASPPLLSAPDPAALQLSGPSALHFSADPSDLTLAEVPDPVLAITDAPSPAQPQILGAAPIRGIATLLASRRLVLVDVENRVQDVLTPQQEVYLKRRIIWELADFWREQRRFLRATGRSLSGSSPLSNFLPPPADRETLAPPIRAFRRLMAWVQTSPVAVSINLFQESRLVPSPASPVAMPPPDLGFPMSPFPQPEPVRPLPPAASPAAPSPSLWQRFQNLLRAVNPLVDHSAAPGPAHPGEPVAAGPVPPAPYPGLLRPFPPQLPNIWFDPDLRGDSEGWQSANQLSQSRLHQELPPIVPSLPVRAKPYLAAAPLWSSYASIGADMAEAMEGAIARIQPMDQESTADVEAFMLDYAAASVPIHELEHYLVDYLQQTDLVHQRGSLAATGPGGAIDEISWDATTRSGKNRAIQARGGAAGSDLEPLDRRDDSDEAALLPTLIEAKASLVRYEKHPLEQLLEWIDLGMLWVEEKITSLFQWVRSRLKN
ncbi:MAG: hypothetical protein VKK04_05240 [Synechococcales bacterium]|nr:hypothetical protein [Synechococcales bacterium]